MYHACMEKAKSIPELVALKQTLNSGQLSPEDATTMKGSIEQAEVMFQEYCTCIAVKAEEGFRMAGYEISPVEIRFLSAAFRFETLYPDKQVRELFGMSVIPCMGL